MDSSLHFYGKILIASSSIIFSKLLQFLTTEKLDPALKKGYFQNKIFLLKISRMSDKSGSLLICILVETNSLTSKNLNKVLRSHTNEIELAS